MCGGAALFDMDDDGDLDAWLVNAGPLAAGGPWPGDRVFRNLGGGRFEDATPAAVRDGGGYGMGIATGDADEDGDVDVLVTRVAADGGRGAVVLWRNDGGGRFTDATAAAGIDVRGWASSAAFTDYDRDGDLDLAVVRYVRWSLSTERRCDGLHGGSDYCSPRSYDAPATSVLLRNDGGMRFTDVSEAAGLTTASGNGLGIVCADYDGDGREDLFVANDGTPNHLWLQQADGTFRERAVAFGCAMDAGMIAKAGMGTLAEDFDDDGDFDLLVHNLAGESDSYFRNDGRLFTDRTSAAGLGATATPFTRFGTGAADFDCDGRPDLYVATGRVTRPPLAVAGDPFAEPDLVFRGTGPARFEEVRPRGGTATPGSFTTRAAAFGDMDGDGGVDVLTAERDAPARLYRNVVPGRGAWTALRVLERSGRPALGAVLTTTLGERRITRAVRSASSYCAANDPTIHLGLGRSGAVSAPGAVEVRWMDGARESFPAPAAGRVHVLRRGTGTPVR
jgi:hypothetical protein